MRKQRLMSPRLSYKGSQLCTPTDFRVLAMRSPSREVHCDYHIPKTPLAWKKLQKKKKKKKKAILLI